MDLFNRMLIYGREVEPSKIGVDNVGLRDWNSFEVSQILLEELPGIIRRITEMLIAKFKERTANLRDAREIIKATREGNLDVEE